MSDPEEQRALIDKISATEPFERSALRAPLLNFLFENRHRWLSSAEVEEEHFDHGELTAMHDPGHARERIADLKRELEKYSASAKDDRWVCRLPDAMRTEGYRLSFEKFKSKRAATELFWLPHLDESQKTMVVCNSHLFFYEPEEQGALRFYDTNDEEKDAALASLEKLHPKAYKSSLEPIWFYYSSGEVNAFEKLQGWFHQRTGRLIQRRVSRDVPSRDILKISPILLGRPDANKYIHKILKSKDAAHLAYCFDKPLGAVKINDPERDRGALSRFRLTDDGLLMPDENREFVFGIVTRLPNPGGRGTVTIISADFYATVITQVMEVLTDDDLIKKLFAGMDWSLEEELPESFEMLFAIRMSPGDMEGEGHAQLLCWRAGGES